MVEILKSPITRKAVFNAVKGIGTVGAFAISSAFAGRVLKKATEQFITGLYFDVQDIKAIIRP